MPRRIWILLCRRSRGAAFGGGQVNSAGLRVDHYDGLFKKTEAEPRLGIALASAVSGIVVRVSYGRTLETPYNEPSF